MERKRHKSDAAAQLLQQEASFHCFNPFAKKIDLKIFTKHLHQKDINIDVDLNMFVFDDSSMSDNQMTRDLHCTSNDK